MNERGDVRGYLRVAVQAVLGREEETVTSVFLWQKLSLLCFKVDYPLGVRQSARIAFPDSCVGRTEKQGGEGEKKPPSTLYSPKTVRQAENILLPQLPTYSLGVTCPKFFPGCRDCPSTQTYPNIFLQQTPRPQQIHAFIPPPKHPGCQLTLSCRYTPNFSL